MVSPEQKSGVIWAVADSSAALKEEARKRLAWEAIDDEAEELRLDQGQKRQLQETLQRSKRDLKEAVWRSYKYVLLLGKDNNIRTVDLGLVHSSAAESMVTHILSRLRQDGDVESAISPNFLMRNWPPAFKGKEWSVKAVRDAFYASPLFPRLLSPDSIKETISKGVAEGFLAYVGKGADGKYEPFIFKREIASTNIEITDDMFIFERSSAEQYEERSKQPPKLSSIAISPEYVQIEPSLRQTFVARGMDQNGRDFPAGEIAWSATGGEIDADGVFVAGTDVGSFVIRATFEGITGIATCIIGKEIPPPPPPPTTKTKMMWAGDVPHQKWMNFYTKVLSKFATGSELKV